MHNRSPGRGVVVEGCDQVSLHSTGCINVPVLVLSAYGLRPPARNRGGVSRFLRPLSCQLETRTRQMCTARSRDGRRGCARAYLGCCVNLDCHPIQTRCSWQQVKVDTYARAGTVVTTSVIRRRIMLHTRLYYAQQCASTFRPDRWSHCPAHLKRSRSASTPAVAWTQVVTDAHRFRGPKRDLEILTLENITRLLRVRNPIQEVKPL